MDQLNQASLWTGVESIDIDAGATRGESRFDLQDLTVRDGTYVDAYLDDELPTAQVDAVLLRRANQPSGSCAPWMLTAGFRSSCAAARSSA